MKRFKLRKESLFIILILSLGAFLRLYRIKDYIVFLGDEGRDALVVWNILHGHLTLLGPTSSVGGFFLGPIYYYMMAPFLWLSRYDPVGPAIMVALLGLVTIYLVYRFGRELFGEVGGLIASLLYAVSPIVIIYSRSSWNPNVMPFFTLSTFYLLYKAVSRKKLVLFALTGFLYGICMQLHYIEVFVGPIIFLYVLLTDFRPKVDWLVDLVKRYFVMLIGFLVGFSPFLAFEARHQFANSQNILRFIFNSPDTGAGGQLFTNIRFVIERLFGGLLVSFPEFSMFKNFNSSLINVWLLAVYAITIVAIGYFVWLFIKTRKEKSSYQKYLLVLLWFVLGIGFFGLYKKSIYDYYLAFLFPVPFLLVGGLLGKVWEYKKWGKYVSLAAVIVLSAISLYFTPIRTPGNQQVNQMKSISDFVLSKTGGKPFNFGIITGGNSDHAYRYFFRLADRDPVVIKGLDVDPQRKSVTDQLFVVCESLPCSPLGTGTQEIAGFGRADIAGDWDVNVVKVYKLVHYKGQ